jgi:CheY-like chemotaxis protein
MRMINRILSTIFPRKWSCPRLKYYSNKALKLFVSNNYLLLSGKSPHMATIICTDFSEKMDEERAKEIGIRQYIEKPINRAVLAKLVRKMLDKK